MDLRDVFLTPLYLALFYLLAYIIRPMVTDRYTRKYFLPGLSVKMFGALALGLIYHFYYGGGDTLIYHHDAGIIWQAFLESPLKAFQLITAQGIYEGKPFEYASRMWFYRDLPSYGVVRFAGFFSILSFNVYSVIALFFAVLSYSGLWVLYLTFYRIYPQLYRPLAWAVLFIPSVFFWGSGILKDTLTLAAMGWATFAVYKIFFQRQNVLLFSFILLLSATVIYSIKIYILLCFLPASILWVFLSRLENIQSVAVKVVLIPFMLAISAGLGYLTILKVGEDSTRYNINNISRTAEVTARWLAYVGEQQEGSVYTLGDFDYSPTGMLRKAPLAVNVTLFRPYLWEVRNPVMLLSALESFFTLFFTLYVFYKRGLRSSLRMIGTKPFLLFCFLFSICFAFSVGIATYNFGTLVRYKIPLLPFYIAALLIIYYSKTGVAHKKKKISSYVRRTPLPA